MRAYVDPSFPIALRALRNQRDMSVRDLAMAAYVGKSTISGLENGKKKPSVEMARTLDDALNAGGSLAALVTSAEVTGEERHRITHALEKPALIDASTVAAFATVLAGQRRLDDSLPAASMLPVVEPQWRTVMQLAKDARGDHADALHEVAAEWTQFLGWLQAEMRDDAAAIRTLTRAIRQADRTGVGALSAQARNFRAYVERQRGNATGIARRFEEAYRTPGASTLQRAGDAAQAAHGHALIGNRQRAERLLGEASELVTRAEDEPPATAYWLSPTFSRLNIGLAYLALGDRRLAAENLRAGLAGLPPEQRDAEWTAEYRRWLAMADREPLPGDTTPA